VMCLVIEFLTLVAVALACVGLRRRYTSVSSCAARTLSGFDSSAPAPSRPSAAHFSAMSRGLPQPQHRSEYRSFAVIRKAHTG
jgi:hypothetical protein